MLHSNFVLWFNGIYSTSPVQLPVHQWSQLPIELALSKHVPCLVSGDHHRFEDEGGLFDLQHDAQPLELSGHSADDSVLSATHSQTGGQREHA